MPLRVDAYGDPLPPFALARLGTIRWRHHGLCVDDLTFSRDGTTLYSAGTGITAFDVATGLPRWASASHASGATALLTHPDRDLIAAAGGVEVALLDATIGAPRGAFPLPAKMLCTVAASRDGRTLLAGGFDRFGALLDRDGAVRATLATERGMYLHSASFSPDDASVVTTDSHGGVVQWSVEDGRKIRSFGDGEMHPSDAVFTPDGAHLVVVSSDGDVHVFDVATGAERSRWKAHPRPAYSVVVTRDGERLVTLGEDRALLLWRLDGERLATRTLSHTSTALCLSPDGATVACAEGPRVVLVDLESFTERAPRTEHSVAIQAMALSNDGETLVTVASLNEARLWSMATYEPRVTFPLASYVRDVRPLPEADRFAVLTHDVEGTLELDLAAQSLSLRVETDRETDQKWWGREVEATSLRGTLSLRNARGERHARKANVFCLAFTPDDRYAVFLEGRKVTKWTMERHVAVWVVPVRQAADLTMSPRGDELAVRTPTAVHRLGVADGDTRSTWKIPEHVYLAAYSPDGARLAVATYSDVRVFDCATEREIARLEGHAAFASALRFDRDGTRLVTGSWDSTALVWSLEEAIAGYMPEVPPKKPARRKAST